VLAAVIVLTFASFASSAVAVESKVLAEFEQKVAVAKKQVEQITASAEIAAGRAIENPEALVNVPYGEQASFAEELVNRAGELANAFPPEERMNLVTKHDVTLIGVRAWDAPDKARMIGLIQRWKKNGSQVVVFGSKAGLPAEVEKDIDQLIDNGAPDGGEASAAVNHLANVLQSHLWIQEYTAALTRKGKYPGVLLSMIMPGADVHNAKLQANGAARRWMGKTDKSIPAGELSAAYLKRVDQLVADIRSEKTMGEIDRAADAIAGQLNSGGKVGVATCTHMLMDEIFKDRKTKMEPFNVVWQAKASFPRNLKEGDMLLWFSYVGLRTVSEDYATAMRGTKAKLVTSFVSEEDASKNAPEAVVHIEQHWKLPDAEVAVPFFPNVMSPVSGLDVGVMYRMIEEEVAERVK